MASADPTQTALLEAYADLARRTGGEPKSLSVAALELDAGADGTPGNPFNLASAAARGFDGPFQEVAARAAELWSDPQTRADESTPVKILARAGEYPDGDVVWPDRVRSISVVFDGPYRIGTVGNESLWTFEPEPNDQGGAVAPTFGFGQQGAPGVGLAFVNFRLGNKTGGHGVVLRTRGAAFNKVTVAPGGLDGFPTVALVGGLHGEIIVPAANLYLTPIDVVGTNSFVASGDISVARIQALVGARVAGDVTVTAAPFTIFEPAAVVNSVLAGDWTGPAGTARFDKFTQDNFAGSFSGGAGAGDYLEA